MAPRTAHRPWLPRRLRPTREGWWFLVATLLIGLAAVNAGLNLLFGVFGMMLFLILASGVLSEMGLRKLTVTRRLPEQIFAGAPFLVGISVRNDKPRVPTFSLEVEDLTDEGPVERRCYFLKLPARREQETSYRNKLDRRGHHRLVGFRLSTRFPFGLIRKSRDIDAPADILVFPALVPVGHFFAARGLANPRESQVVRPARGGEYAGLRDFRTGDDPRQIHWRTSARRGRLLVRESEEETSRNAVVSLDDPRPAPPTDMPDPAFEAAISLSASVALHLLDQGFSVALVLAGQLQVPAGKGPHTTRAILTALACLKSARPSTHERPMPIGKDTLRIAIRVGTKEPQIRFDGQRAVGSETESAA